MYFYILHHYTNMHCNATAWSRMSTIGRQTLDYRTKPSQTSTYCSCTDDTCTVDYMHVWTKHGHSEHNQWFTHQRQWAQLMNVWLLYSYYVEDT